MITHHGSILLISNLLHFPAMVGYNRYSVSLARELTGHVPGGIVWVPLERGIHPDLRHQLTGAIGLNTRSRGLAAQLELSSIDRRVRPALWHVLTDHPVPWLVSSPVVVTCHGLPRWVRHRHMIRDGQLPGRFWDYQDSRPGFGVRRSMARDWVFSRMDLNVATAVIAVSEYVRWELVNKFGIRAAKIHVVHLAADAVFEKPRSPAEVDAVRAKYGLPPRFVLGVASFSKTKNTEGLLQLAAGLAATPDTPPMVLVGPAGAIDHYTRQARASLIEGQTVFLLHNIPDDDLACVYRAADLFVNLAWEESFGLPIVEAMAAGTAVVASDRTAIPEIVGEGGLIVNPADPEAVLRAVRGVLTDPELRATLAARARRRAADFSWAKAARETAAVYDRVLSCRTPTRRSALNVAT